MLDFGMNLLAWFSLKMTGSKHLIVQYHHYQNYKKQAKKIDYHFAGSLQHRSRGSLISGDYYRPYWSVGVPARWFWDGIFRAATPAGAGDVTVRYEKYILNRVIKAFPIRQSHWPMGVPICIANPNWSVGTPIGQWGSRLVSGSYCRTGWTISSA